MPEPQPADPAPPPPRPLPDARVVCPACGSGRLVWMLTGEAWCQQCGGRSVLRAPF